MFDRPPVLVIPSPSECDIDPTALKKNEARVLSLLLIQNFYDHGTSVFFPYDPDLHPFGYTVTFINSNPTKPNIIRTIFLAKPIIVHYDHAAKKDHLKLRYSVATTEEDDRLGGGSFAEVYRVIGTLKHAANNERVIYKGGKKRAVKIQHIDIACEALKYEFVCNEAFILPKLLHLNAKPVTYYQEDESKISAYFVMNEISGMSLEEYLEADKAGVNKYITLMERVQISFKLAQALYEQFHRFNVIHRDLKPANILYDGRNLNIIDANLSLYAPKGDDGKCLGTMKYVAPEMLLNRHPISFSVDYYALGLILLELWLGTKRSKSTVNLLNLLKENKELAEIPSVEKIVTVTGLDKLHAESVVTCIQGLLNFNPSARPTPQIVAKVFRDIELALRLNIFSSEQRTKATAIQTLALETRTRLNSAASLPSQKAIHEIKSIIQDACAELEKCNDTGFVPEFITLLDIDAFAVCQTVNDIRNISFELFEHFNTYSQELNILEEQIKAKMNLLEKLYKLNYSNFYIFIELDEILKNTVSLIEKRFKAKRYFTLDEYDKLNQKFMLGIEAIKTKIASFDHLDLDPITNSYNVIINRLQKTSLHSEVSELQNKIKFYIREHMNGLLTAFFTIPETYQHAAVCEKAITEILDITQESKKSELICKLKNTLPSIRAASFFRHEQLAEKLELVIESVTPTLN